MGFKKYEYHVIRMLESFFLMTVVKNFVNRRSSIICFGDSLTQFGFDDGWLALLSNRYVRRADVFNRGFSGYNTRWALQIAPKIFEEFSQGIIFKKFSRLTYQKSCLGCIPGGPPLFITIFFGTNDASTSACPAHISESEFTDNMEKIISLACRVVPNKQVLVITPGKLNEVKWLAHLHTL